jgi:hypothetical protein
MKKLKMNTQLLQKVKQNILDHPDQFYMGGFFSAYTANGKAGGCGTAACIAGWAVYLHRRYSSLARAAVTMLKYIWVCLIASYFIPPSGLKI